ncbi:hypothetical protein [Mycobacterium talmoniae]|uniref:Rod shape-determining protein MreD n=1 Tax=Mycobacterium talmoniae TaxID=1858794 RepID=A0A1S1NPZ4_9MYCO|nr:hypothetical protein [Mycobacterium talmoniae]OHV06555.1 hypothetical protein BKN37_01610 [Mycobacterium talmoniae]
MTVLQSTNPAVTRWAREVVFPVLAVAVIVAYADLRIPMGLPGHRGLIWLTLLVAVALTTRRRETVLAVGAAATAATLLLQLAPGPADSARYLGAALLLYAVAAAPVVRRRRWLLALAAAPIHLVALAGSVAALLGGGQLLALASVGMTDRVLFHLGFGLVAGLLGWAIALRLHRPVRG